MITHAEQLDLLKLISSHLSKPVEAWVFGGTAMLFYGYKDVTKDIDILFTTHEERDIFKASLETLGFKQTTTSIYRPDKQEHTHKPELWERGDTRFDLFVKQVFKTKWSPALQQAGQIHEIREGSGLKVTVVAKKHLIYLKAITGRKRDFDDIVTLVERSRIIDWDAITDEAIWQYQHGNDWALIDVEETLQNLQSHVEVPKEQIQKLHAAHDKNL